MKRKNTTASASDFAFQQKQCSFCGKLQNEVPRLVQGSDHITICNECVELAHELCTESTEGQAVKNPIIKLSKKLSSLKEQSQECLNEYNELVEKKNKLSEELEESSAKIQMVEVAIRKQYRKETAIKVIAVNFKSKQRV